MCLTSLFDRVPTPILLIDTSGKVMGVNDSYVVYHNCRSKEEALDSVKDLELYSEVASEVLTNGYFEKEHFFKEGYWVKIQASIVNDSEGCPIAISVLEKDITIRKKLLPELTFLKTLRSTV